jgi:hypothetical protein
VGGRRVRFAPIPAWKFCHAEDLAHSLAARDNLIYVPLSFQRKRVEVTMVISAQITLGREIPCESKQIPLQ